MKEEKKFDSILPTSKKPPNIELNRLKILLYGQSKIGKSTFCSKMENALFIATEPGLSALETYDVPVSSWQEILKVSLEISKMNHNFDTIIIDTVDNAFRMCTEYICEKHKIDHESELSYGKGYALRDNEFHRVINKLSMLPIGLIMISHSQERDIETRTGKHTRIVPTLPEKTRKMITGLVDLILYCDVESDMDQNGKSMWKRIIRTKPNPNYDAGDRTGKLPEVLELNFDIFKSYLCNED